MSIGPIQLLLILLIILLLFGAGKLPRVMSDLGRGFKSFKSAINEEKDDPDQDKEK
ncbi:MAG: twin-arginine translocase TatA/TatE family subunit [Rickettsiaceae bacterium]